MSEPFEPINLRCPECKAEPMEDCRYGGDVGYHPSRFDAAEEWKAAALTPANQPPANAVSGGSQESAQ